MKVFVSATTKGLGSYRQGVAKMLKALRADPIEQGELDADYRTLIELLKAKIADCQAVICLIGPAYGAAPRGQPSHLRPRSYTQIEYEFARLSNRRVYVLRPSPECRLDDFDQSPEDARLQDAFWSEVRSKEERPRTPFENQASLDVQIVKIWNELQTGSEQPTDEQVLPSPCTMLLRELPDIGSVERVQKRLSLLFALVASVITAGAPARRCPLRREWPADGIDAALGWLRALSDDAGDPASAFMPELHAWLREQLPSVRCKLDALCAIRSSDLSKGKAESHLRNWHAAVAEVVGQWTFFQGYLLVAVEFDKAGSPVLRVYRGLNAEHFVPVTLAGQSPDEGPLGSLFLLSLARREALDLSSCLMSYPANPTILCVISPSKASDGVQLIPLGDEEDACEVSLAKAHPQGWRGPLLSNNSWDALRIQFQSEADRGLVIGPGLRLLAEMHPGHFFQLYWAEGNDVPSGELTVVHRLKDVYKEDVPLRQRLEERLLLWRHLAEADTERVLRPLEASDCSVGAIEPFIATRLQEGATSLQQTVQLNRSLITGDLFASVKAALDVCQVAERLGLCLLAIPPRHILAQSGRQYQFTGFDTVVRADKALPPADVLRQWFTDWTDFAPELKRGGRRPTCSADVFAVGALLQRLRDRQVTPLPLGEKDDSMWGEWRRDPLECFVYHCLARDPKRRFQSIAQCAAFFERCADGVGDSKMILPELALLKEGLSIGRLPVMNFEFERFCHDTRRTPPTLGLSARYCGPFAPVVNVSVRDAEDYCRWLTASNPTGGVWRLPWESEWLRAASSSSEQAFLFPWGNETPTLERATFYGEYSGPTVVGAHPSGVSRIGCHDLSGNVWEWCQDCLPGEPKRMLKGGSHGSPPEDLKLSVGRTRLFGGRYDDVGFRVIHERR